MPAPTPVMIYAVVPRTATRSAHVQVLVPGGEGPYAAEVAAQRQRGQVVLWARQTGSLAHVTDRCRRPAAELGLQLDALVAAVVEALVETRVASWPHVEPKVRLGRPPRAQTPEIPRTIFSHGGPA